MGSIGFVSGLRGSSLVERLSTTEKSLADSTTSSSRSVPLTAVAGVRLDTATDLPSGLKATPESSAPGVVNRRSSAPVATSHSTAAPSAPTVARADPSGLNAASVDSASCALNFRTSAPVALSHSSTDPSPAVAANTVPPGW